MTLDEILSQAAGGFNLQALSLDNILRAVLVLAVGVVAIKLIQRAVERIFIDITTNNNFNLILF